ncbi:MAG TPA: WhiB family transcriptional regulator [Mycobacterium sp.]|jgi:WhiB family redox-sensing transcriptional regulator|uniref:WhiB family transcriptional regulator n=1 Tax=Mycobacterium sp. TaxID=1785 RepID=UPI002F405523
MTTPVFIGLQPSSSDDEEWRHEAACASVGGDFWFPEKGGSTAEAKKVCRTCPVVTECGEYALATQQRFGIWGNLSERERRHIANVRKRASARQAEAA